jgi:hypothetical protein
MKVAGCGLVASYHECSRLTRVQAEGALAHFSVVALRSCRSTVRRPHVSDVVQIAGIHRPSLNPQCGSNSFFIPQLLSIASMARKAAQKAAQAPPLDGCTIATSGKFPGTTQAALGARITSLGATTATKVTADTNILIATEKDYESNSTKVKAAASHNVPVVTLEWLEECESTSESLASTRSTMLILTIMQMPKQMRRIFFCLLRPLLQLLHRVKPMDPRSALHHLTRRQLRLKMHRSPRRSQRSLRTPK